MFDAFYINKYIVDKCTIKNKDQRPELFPTSYFMEFTSFFMNVVYNTTYFNTFL